MIIERLLKNISSAIGMSESDLRNLQVALRNCEICNYIRPYEARIFTNYGIPIMQVLANILNEPITGIAEKINNKESPIKVSHKAPLDSSPV